MAYDRFTCICRPLKSFTWNYRSASKGILLSWILAAIISSPQLLIFKLTTREVANGTKVTSCFAIFPHPSDVWEMTYIIYHATTQFIIPVIIITFIYTKIFISIQQNLGYKKESNLISKDSKKFEKKNKRENIYTFKSKSSKIENNLQTKLIKPTQDTSKTNNYQSTNLHLTISFNAKDHQNKKEKVPIRSNFSSDKLSRSKMKALKLTITVVITYIACSMPFYVFEILFAIFGKYYRDNYAVSNTLYQIFSIFLL